MNKLPEEEKEQFLSEMRNFIEEEDRWLQDLMGQIGWSINDFPKFLKVNPVKYRLCPINNEHRVPETSLESHVLKCSKKYEKYPDSSQEALCLIEETTDNTVDKSNTTDLALLQPSNEGSASASQSSSSQCLIELLTAERDAKRRRAAYRKKRIHTNKKSYNEILRELIDNEMKTLECSKIDEDFGNDSNSANIIEEHVESSSIYAGVGNWIYNGNPYKRWMTIKKEEEELESLKIKDFKKQIHSDYQSKNSRDSTRHFSRDRYSLHHNSDHSSNPRELARFPRSEHRHYDKRPRFSSSRHSSQSGVNSPPRKRTDRNLSRGEHKRYDHSNNDKKMEESHERRRFSKTYISSVKRESAIETRESSFKSSERSRSKKSLDESAVNKEEARICDKNTERKHEEKYSKSSGCSSSSSDMEVKRHKKKHKKKHRKKHTKKMKKRQSSLQSS